MTMTAVPIDQARLEAFLGQAVTDLAAAQAVATAYLGDRLGLYRALGDGEPTTSADLAADTGTNERLVREWLAAQVAGGWMTHDPDTDTYRLPIEHAAVVADPASPTYIGGMFEIIAAVWAGADRLEAAFRDDGAVGWGEHDPRLFTGVERLFGPIYRHQLVEAWLPQLDGVEQRLRSGARVADVGCGHGASTLVMAEAFPASRFDGFDAHAPSIEAARTAAAERGITDWVSFQQVEATELPAEGYDLICFFDCLHDMGDPVGAARRAREALADDGTVLLVEPAAGDSLEDNHNPVSRLYYAGSVFLCTPSSLAQDVGLGLGAQAGPARLREVFEEAGFTRFRQAAATPFNLVLEARP